MNSDTFINTLIAADQTCKSWREKLLWIDNFLSNNTLKLTTEHLIYIAIYLHFIGTCEIPCAEDGRHFRPSLHANTAQHIQDQLSKVTTSENVFIIRKIYPLLPSFADNFTRKEPLTRIRDIAHRNDIPGDLKREIKTTLQNKLHRCADPKDLITSSALLKKITAPEANYSHDFVKEFKEFHKELKCFFNANSLEEQLETLVKEDSSSYITELIHKFLETKEKIDTLEGSINNLKFLTALRSHINKNFKKKINYKEQKLQLIDIGLENFSFVLLSQFINFFDTYKKEINWQLILYCLELTTKNLRLNGFNIEECQAIESEISAWNTNFDCKDKMQLLRIKATVDRCKRLVETYCNNFLILFSEKAKELGYALNIEEYKINIFCEACIRQHIVFQLSKLVTFILKEIKKLAKLPLWDVISPGKVSGYLVEASCFKDLSLSSNKKNIVIMEKINCDEDIPVEVVGLITPSEIPSLSHFSIRARQENIVFIICEDKSQYTELRKNIGKQIVLDCSAEETSFKLL